MTTRTTAARAEQTIRLLWRDREPQERRRGPAPGRTIDELVSAGIEIADRDGLPALTVRRLAERLQVSRMALYNYVADLDQLAELMIDSVHAELFDGRIRIFPYGPRSRPPADPLRSWQRAVRTVAGTNLDLVRRHPWLIARPNDRPVLGPYTTAKYEAELAAFDRLGLAAVEMDLALWQVLNHVRGIAGDLLAGQSAPESTAEWWQASGAAAAARISAEEFPLATGVGSSVGDAQQAAYDPLASYKFGLSRILDGLQVLVDRRG
ncbi:MAG TPA: TetR/AcrR family transcriptional regulator C-terminal domain-containing protein [Microlunatus sp.]